MHLFAFEEIVLFTRRSLLGCRVAEDLDFHALQVRPEEVIAAGAGEVADVLRQVLILSDGADGLARVGQQVPDDDGFLGESFGSLLGLS